MDLIFDNCNNAVNLFSNNVGNILFNDLNMTHSVFTKRCTPGIVDKTIVLSPYRLIFSYFCFGIATDNKIIWRLN